MAVTIKLAGVGVGDCTISGSYESNAHWITRERDVGCQLRVERRLAVVHAARERGPVGGARDFHRLRESRLRENRRSHRQHRKNCLFHPSVGDDAPVAELRIVQQETQHGICFCSAIYEKIVEKFCYFFVLS